MNDFDLKPKSILLYRKDPFISHWELNDYYNTLSHHALYVYQYYPFVIEYYVIVNYYFNLAAHLGLISLSFMTTNYEYHVFFL